MPDAAALPTSFNFAVSLDAADAARADGVFQELSGLETQVDIDEISEGGANRFVHALPRGVKHPNLVLKRGMAPPSSLLVDWARHVLEGSLAMPVQTRNIRVSLRDTDGKAVAAWDITNAWPVKWDISAFVEAKNDLLIEKLELAFSSVQRVI